MTWKRSVDTRVAWLILQEAYACLDVSRFFDRCVLHSVLLPSSFFSTFLSAYISISSSSLRLILLLLPPLPPPSSPFPPPLPPPSSFAFDMACAVGWALNSRCYLSHCFLTLASVSMLGGEYAVPPAPLLFIRPQCLLHSLLRTEVLSH